MDYLTSSASNSGITSEQNSIIQQSHSKPCCTYNVHVHTAGITQRTYLRTKSYVFTSCEALRDLTIVNTWKTKPKHQHHLSTSSLSTRMGTYYIEYEHSIKLTIRQV